MANVGDILRITDCQKLFGQDVCNILYYVVSAWTGNLTLEDVIDPFIDTFISGIRTRQNPALAHVNIVVDNLTDGNSFAERSVNIVGANPTASEPQPSFVAFSVTKKRSSKITRSGSIRIAGVSEGDTDGNDNTLSEAEKAELEDALTSPLTLTDAEGEFTLTPVIVGTNVVTNEPDVTRYQVFSTALFRGISTQRSRKAQF